VLYFVTHLIVCYQAFLSDHSCTCYWYWTDYRITYWQRISMWL